jgi:hypothetical protein
VTRRGIIERRRAVPPLRTVDEALSTHRSFEIHDLSRVYLQIRSRMQLSLSTMRSRDERVGHGIKLLLSADRNCC